MRWYLLLQKFGTQAMLKMTSDKYHAVLPQLAKVIEKLQIQLNISDLNIKNNQHAFTRDRSTVFALISTTQSWYNATDNSQSGRKGVHVIFKDFRRAFDLVNHNIL